MSNVEILGRPLYLPVKNKLQKEQNPLVQLKSKESKKPLTYVDLVYERDATEENQTSQTNP